MALGAESFSYTISQTAYVHATAAVWIFQKNGGGADGSAGGIFTPSLFLTTALCTDVQAAPGDTVSQKHCKSEIRPAWSQGY